MTTAIAVSEASKLLGKVIDAVDDRLPALRVYVHQSHRAHDLIARSRKAVLPWRCRRLRAAAQRAEARAGRARGRLLALVEAGTLPPSAIGYFDDLAKPGVQ